MSAVAQRVEMVTTTASERWKNQKVKVQKIHEGKADIYVYPDSLMQEIEGFGGTFNELGWDALQSLSSEERAKVMSSLFSEEGVNFVIPDTLPSRIIPTSIAIKIYYPLKLFLPFYSPATLMKILSPSPT